MLSAVVMGISQTIARERVFEPLRNALGGKETWFGYLVSCPYCASHWIAFVLVPLFGVYPMRVAVHWGFLSTLLDVFFSAVLVTVVAAFMRVFFWFADEYQALVRRRKAHEEVETERERVMQHRLERKELEAQERHPPH